MTFDEQGEDDVERGRFDAVQENGGDECGGESNQRGDEVVGEVGFSSESPTFETYVGDRAIRSEVFEEGKVNGRVEEHVECDETESRDSLDLDQSFVVVRFGLDINFPVEPQRSQSGPDE